MKDWATLQPDVVKLLDKHFTRGRAGAGVEFIVLHHLAGIGTTEEVWGWWQTREASAHYIVETSGRIGQTVWDRDTAWANADAWANQRSITIEHSNTQIGDDTGWPIADITLEEGAHLVAAVCLYYNLGRPNWGTNVRGHSDFFATSCPKQLAPGGWYHEIYMQRAGEWYDVMTGASNKTEVNMESTEYQRLTTFITAEADRVINHMSDFVTGFVGPIGSDVKDIREQLTGGRNAGEYPGWPQLGQNINGDDLSLVDGLAAARVQIVVLENIIKEISNG